MNTVTQDHFGGLFLAFWTPEWRGLVNQSPSEWFYAVPSQLACHQPPAENSTLELCDFRGRENARGWKGLERVTHFRIYVFT